MVKRQREKLYPSAREHRESRGTTQTGSIVQGKLPFSHCALSMTPYSTPSAIIVQERYAVLFDHANLVEFVQKYGRDPVIGLPMTTKDILMLIMDQNVETEQWQCPVLKKPFFDRTKIVAIRVPVDGEGGKVSQANVYSYEAYHELNIKPKSYEDLVSGQPFDRTKDVLLLNDPDDSTLQKVRDTSQFYHIKNARHLRKSNESEDGAPDIRQSVSGQRVLDKLQKEAGKKQKHKDSSYTNDDTTAGVPTIDIDGTTVPLLVSDVKGVALSAGRASSAFTSTSLAVVDAGSDERHATQEDIFQANCEALRKLKTKAYVRLTLSWAGKEKNISLELHCDSAPQACWKFIEACNNKKYDETAFGKKTRFVLIHNYTQIQSKVGSSKDKFDERLTHSRAGVLTMNTNNLQFGLTLAACPHLDREQTVFGQVIEEESRTGDSVISQLAVLESNIKDQVKSEVRIQSIAVLDDPTVSAARDEQHRIEANVRRRLDKTTRVVTRPEKTPKPPSALTLQNGVEEPINPIGRYLKKKRKLGSSAILAQDINPPFVDEPRTVAATQTSTRSSDKMKKQKNYGDFSSW